MSTSPNRQKIDWGYTHSANGVYWETFYIKSYSLFRLCQLLHTTTTVNDYETITINYKPKGSLSSYSSSNEIALRLSV